MIDIQKIKTSETMEGLEFFKYQVIFHGNVVDERTRAVFDSIRSLGNDIRCQIKVSVHQAPIDRKSVTLST